MTPPRRWFRFSMRTMLILVAISAIPFGWVRYQLDWIRERHSAIDNIDVYPAHFDYLPDKAPPWSLRLFGKKPLGASFLHVKALEYGSEEFNRRGELFPEFEGAVGSARLEPPLYTRWKPAAP